MTARNLIKYLEDLPEELKDVDMEYVVDYHDLGKDYTARVDQYIGAIVHSVENKEVLLMSFETIQKIEGQNV